MTRPRRPPAEGESEHAPDECGVCDARAAAIKALDDARQWARWGARRRAADAARERTEEFHADFWTWLKRRVL